MAVCLDYLALPCVRGNGAVVRSAEYNETNLGLVLEPTLCKLSDRELTIKFTSLNVVSSTLSWSKIGRSPRLPVINVSHAKHGLRINAH